MAKTPGIRQSDLSAALAGVTAVGLKPRRITFTRDGGFTFDFDDLPRADNDTDLDDELAAFEARHDDR